MKVYGVFHKGDIETPPLTAEQVINKEYTKYGISEEDFNAMMGRFEKELINAYKEAI